MHDKMLIIIIMFQEQMDVANHLGVMKSKDHNFGRVYYHV